jgi:hypothetical protein
MNEEMLYIVKVDDKIHISSHDFKYANKVYLSFLKIKKNKGKAIRFITYGYVRSVTSYGNVVKKTFA